MKKILNFGIILFLIISTIFYLEKKEVQADNVNILTLGDSVTHGYPYIGTSSTYPAKLQIMIDENFGVGHTVINRGVSGYRADQVLLGLQTEGWLATDNPDYVLLMVGGNDLAQEIDPLDITTIPVVIDNTVAEVQDIIDLINNHTNSDGSTPQIIVSAFIPNNLSGIGGTLVVAAYNNDLKNDLTDYDVYFETNWDDFYDSGTGQADTSLMADSAHPNVQGYELMANNWYQELSPLLPTVTSDTDDDKDDSDSDDSDNSDNSDDNSDTDDSTDSNDSIPSLAILEPRILTTSGPGEVTRLQAYSRHGEALGNEINNIFSENYKGGAGIVSIDANNNGLKDQIVVFAINNGGPQARVFGLRENNEMYFMGQMFLFDSSIRDGLSITSGDFDGDGYDDDIASCLTGDRKPTVRVYSDVIGVDNWEKIAEFDALFGNVGCNLGTFQYDSNEDEILVTPNHGPEAPELYIYSSEGGLRERFLAYSEGVNNGLTSSGIGDRIYTTPNNGTSHVRVFDKSGNPKNFWWAYDNMNVVGDFKNIAGDIDLDGKEEILISPIGANGPQVLAYEPSGKWRTWPNFFAFGDETLRNGVGIAVIDNYHGIN